MTLDEAIKHCEEVQSRDDLCTSCKEEHQQLSDWLKDYKVLKERATPKKLEMMRIKKYDGYNIGICKCGKTIDASLDDDANFCPNCGQSLDWSDE